jgi:hypothetical protein
VIDCFDRSILGWSFSLRCRAKDCSPAMAMAWGNDFPHGVDSDQEIAVRLRHDNGTQFTSHHRSTTSVVGPRHHTRVGPKTGCKTDSFPYYLSLMTLKINRDFNIARSMLCRSSVARQN